MKQLYINNKRVIISEDSYFPFTYKVTDLENVDFINIPSSKTINIPINAQNNEIFGYICEITRQLYDATDNKVSVSFNQIKKATYQLFDDSQLVSEGLVVIDNITNTDYECTLYDVLIDLIESLEDQTLDELVIKNKLNNNPLNVALNSSSAHLMSYIPEYGIHPVFGKSDSNLNKSKIVCKTKSEGSFKTDVIDLPVELDPLQARTFKSYDSHWAIPVISIMDAISEKNPKIEFTNKVRQRIYDLYMQLNKPTMGKESAYDEFTNQSHSNKTLDFAPNGTWMGGGDGDIDTYNAYSGGYTTTIRNGNNHIKVGYDMTFKDDTTYQSNMYMQYGGKSFFSYTPKGTVVGVIRVKSFLTLKDNLSDDILYVSKPVENRIELIKDINCFFW